MSPFLEKAMSRVPVTLEVGVRTFFCGPESFTPDLMPAVGEAPGIRHYFVAAGMNSVGVLSAGGLGRVLARWVVSGLPDVDVTAWDVARFRTDQLDPAYRRERTTEILGPSTPRTPRASSCTRCATGCSPCPRPAGRQRRPAARGLGLGGCRLVRRSGGHAEAEPTWGPGAVVRAVEASTASSARASG
jgi:4-methylaminobutanoate oxidase (formaldehyde-forming)